MKTGYEKIGEYREYIRKNISKAMVGIEFGPSHTPLLPKADGYKVFVIDYESREDIIKRHLKNPELANILHRVEKVDAIDTGEDLREMLNCPEGFDYVVSAHNIEHLPDPIKFFQRVEKALKPDGILYMLVPDRRFTFDFLRPVSTIGQLIEAHQNQRKIHNFASIFDYQAYATVGNGPYGNHLFSDTFEKALECSNRAIAENTYTDVHAWIYTASSFQFVFSVLRRLAFITMNIKLIDSSERVDFLVVMDKNQVAGEEVDLNELAVQCLRESVNSHRAKKINITRNKHRNLTEATSSKRVAAKCRQSVKKSIVHVLCLFVPRKAWRHRIRAKLLAHGNTHLRQWRRSN